MKKGLAYILISLSILSCKPKQKTVETPIITENSQPKVLDNKWFEEINEVQNKNEFNFSTLAINSSLKYEDDKQSLALGADIRIKKDEIIWLNIKLIGIPMAKAIITPTRVSYYEKTNNTYFDGDYSLLSNWLGMDLDFQKVQNLFLGKSLEKLDKNWIFNKMSDFIFAEKKDSETYFRTNFDENSKLLKSQYLKQENQQRNVGIVYPSHSMQNNIFLPNGVFIKAEQQKAVTINVEYKKMTFNEDLNFSYTIPNGYEAIKIK